MEEWIETYGELAQDGLILSLVQQAGLQEEFQLGADGAERAVRRCWFDPAHLVFFFFFFLWVFW